MFESLIREAASRFHLGDNAARFVRMLVDGIFDEHNGGFAGLQQRFANAGLGDAFGSWIGASPGDNDLQPDQFNTVYGPGPVERIASALGVPLATVNMAGASLLPRIIGMLTRGGTIPTSRPADYDRWFAAAPAAAAVPAATHRTTTTTATTTPQERRGGGMWMWLIPLILLLGAFLLFRSCNSEPAAPPPAPAETTPATTTTDTTTTAPRFGFENVDGRVNVSGQLATEAERTRLWDSLVSTFGADAVNGDIVVNAATAPAEWLDRLAGMLPDLQARGLKFGFEGERINIDTSGLPEEERVEISQRLRGAFGGYEMTGLWDRAMAALSGLRPGYSASDLAGALNLMNVYFETGSARITRDSAEVLERAAEAIKGAPSGTRFEVGGHTDNTGDAAANMTLSQERADAVVARLGELGVASGTLTARGYGQDNPKADNSTEEGRAQNRRIEFTVPQ